MPGPRTWTQVLADRAAALLLYVAVAAGAITALVWVALGQPAFAIDRPVMVLIIACPHALAGAVEADSEHPFARAIHAHAREVQPHRHRAQRP